MARPFHIYSWVMLAVSAVLFVLLFALEMLLSYALSVDEAKPTGFTAIDQPTS